MLYDISDRKFLIFQQQYLSKKMNIRSVKW